MQKSNDIINMEGVIRMEYIPQLSFLRQMLKNMNISSTILEEPQRHISPEIDQRLRAFLFDLNDYAGFLQNSIMQAKDHTLYRFYDEYGCSYLFLKLPGSSRYFFIGPYLLSLPDEQWIASKIKSLSLENEKARWMQLYYTSLPLLENENFLLTMVGTLADCIWGGPEQYTMEYVEYAIPDRREPVAYTTAPIQAGEMAFDLVTLEKNYANENRLMDAISKGKIHLINAVADTVFNNGAQSRLSDSLRDRKNNLVILKTLLRKAAEYGGVHPLHIHHLSSHYAGKIENIRTIRESLTLQEAMIRSFCQLVKKHSLNRYSDYVAQTITLVQYDLTADLRLKTIAERLNVNASYLSRIFHQEYGCTLTEFINKQRIDHSIRLLQTTNRTVVDIASECGIQDVNYFIKLFKKQTGLTPVQFREKQMDAFG